MIDSRDITQLDPALQRAAAEFIKRCQTSGVTVILTCTYRDNEAQATLYAQGRTAPGSIVTNAKPGESMHNYRLAFDFAPELKDGSISWSAANPQWKQCGGIGQAMGLDWGGSWTGSLVDMPHFEYTGGLTLAQLQAGKQLASDAKLPWETISVSVNNGNVSPNADSASPVTTGVMEYNGNPVEVERILQDGFNYVKLRDMEQFGLQVDYDAVKNEPVVSSGNK